MTNEIMMAWGLAALVGVVLATFLWWALADFFLATVEIPFVEFLARWRRGRDKASEGDAPADAST